MKVYLGRDQNNVLVSGAAEYTYEITALKPFKMEQSCNVLNNIEEAKI